MSKIKFGAQVIIPAGEHEAILKDGVLFVALVSNLPAGDSGESTDEPAPTKTAAAKRPVADDTAPAGKNAAAPARKAAKAAEPVEAAPAARRKKAAPVETEDDSPAAPEEIAPIDWKKLKAGTTLLARVLDEDGDPLLDASNNDSEYFAVDVVSVSKSGEVTVEYHCDGEQTVLQEGDQLFEYNVDLI
jgi:hypothetical protein